MSEILVGSILKDLTETNLSAAANPSDATLQVPIVGVNIPNKCYLTLTDSLDDTDLLNAEIVEISNNASGTLTVVKSLYQGIEDTTIQGQWPSGTTAVILFNEWYFNSLKDAINSIITEPHVVDAPWKFLQGFVLNGDPTSVYDEDGAFMNDSGILKARQAGVWRPLLTSGLPVSAIPYATVYNDPTLNWTTTETLRTKTDEEVITAPVMTEGVSIKKTLNIWGAGGSNLGVQVTETEVNLLSEQDFTLTANIFTFVGDVVIDELTTTKLTTPLITAASYLTIDPVEGINVFSAATVATGNNKIRVFKPGTTDVVIQLDGYTGQVVSSNTRVKTKDYSTIAAIITSQQTTPWTIASTGAGLHQVNYSLATGESVNLIHFMDGDAYGSGDPWEANKFSRHGYIKSAGLTLAGKDLKAEVTDRYRLRGYYDSAYVDYVTLTEADGLVFDEGFSATKTSFFADSIVVGGDGQATPSAGEFRYTPDNGFEGRHNDVWWPFQTVSADLPVSTHGYILRFDELDNDWRGTHLLQVLDNKVQTELPIYGGGIVKIGDLQEAESAQVGMVRFAGDFEGYMSFVNNFGDVENYWTSLTGGGTTKGSRNGEFLIYNTSYSKWLPTAENMYLDEGDFRAVGRLRGLTALGVPQAARIPGDALTGADIETQVFLIENELFGETIEGGPSEAEFINGLPEGQENWVQVLRAEGSERKQDIIRAWGQLGTRTVQVNVGTDIDNDPILEEHEVPVFGWINLNSINEDGVAITLPNPSGHNNQMLIVRANQYAWTSAFTISDDEDTISSTYDVELMSDLTVHELGNFGAIFTRARINISEPFEGEGLPQNVFALGLFDTERNSGGKLSDDWQWQIGRLVPTEESGEEFPGGAYGEDSWEATDLAIYYKATAREDNFYEIDPIMPVRINRSGNIWTGGDITASGYLKSKKGVTLTRIEDHPDGVSEGTVVYNGDLELFNGNNWLSLTNRLAIPRKPVPLIKAGTVINIGGDPYTVSNVTGLTSSDGIVLTTTATHPINSLVTFPNGGQARLLVAASSNTIYLDELFAFLPGFVTINGDTLTCTDFSANDLTLSTSPGLDVGDEIVFATGAKVLAALSYGPSGSPQNIRINYAPDLGSTISFDLVNGWSYTDTTHALDSNLYLREGIVLRNVVSADPEPGMMKYQGDFLGWNGSAWVSLTGYGDTAIPVGPAGEMLVSNGTIWQSSPDVTYLSNVMRIGNVLKLGEFEDDPLPEEDWEVGMIRRRGDMEYFNGLQWVSMTDYFGLPGGHLPQPTGEEVWQDGSMLRYVAPFEGNPKGLWTVEQKSYFNNKTYHGTLNPLLGITIAASDYVIVEYDHTTGLCTIEDGETFPAISNGAVVTLANGETTTVNGAVLSGATTLLINTHSADINSVNIGGDLNIEGWIKFDAPTPAYIRYTGDDVQAFVADEWKSLTFKSDFPIDGTIGSTLYLHQFDGHEGWVATPKLLVLVDNVDPDLVTSVRTILDGTSRVKGREIEDQLLHSAWDAVQTDHCWVTNAVEDGDSQILGIGYYENITDFIQLGSNLISLVHDTVDDALDHVEIPTLEVPGTLTVGSVMATDLETINGIIGFGVISGTQSTAGQTALVVGVELAPELNETELALDVRGLAKFSSTVQIGDSKSEAPVPGQMRYHNNDYQGWTSDNRWVSFSGAVQDFNLQFGGPYTTGSVLVWNQTTEEWEVNQNLIHSDYSVSITHAGTGVVFNSLVEATSTDAKMELSVVDGAYLEILSGFTATATSAKLNVSIVDALTLKQAALEVKADGAEGVLDGDEGYFRQYWVTTSNVWAWTGNDFDTANPDHLILSNGITECFRMEGTGMLTVPAFKTGSVTINAAGSGLPKTVSFKSGGVSRWHFTVTGSESTADAGSNMYLSAWDDSGAYIDDVIVITRAAGGAIGVNRPIELADDLVATGSITSSNIHQGSGSPEGAVTAAIGSLYQRTDAAPAAYIKNSGAGNTGWLPLTPRGNQAFTAQTSVTVTHNLGMYPLVQVMDGSGVLIAPATVTHSSVNAFTVTFGGSTTGTIIY